MRAAVSGETASGSLGGMISGSVRRIGVWSSASSSVEGGFVSL
jgi:hypothetical protein